MNLGYSDLPSIPSWLGQLSKLQYLNIEAATQGFVGHAPVVEFVRSPRTLTHGNTHTHTPTHTSMIFAHTEMSTICFRMCTHLYTHDTRTHNMKSFRKQPSQSHLPELILAYLKQNNFGDSTKVPVTQPAPHSRLSLFQILMFHSPTPYKVDMFSSMSKLARLDLSKTKYEFAVVPAHMSPRPVHTQYFHWQMQSEGSSQKH